MHGGQGVLPRKPGHITSQSQLGVLGGSSVVSRPEPPYHVTQLGNGENRLAKKVCNFDLLIHTIYRQHIIQSLAWSKSWLDKHLKLTQA